MIYYAFDLPVLPFNLQFSRIIIIMFTMYFLATLALERKYKKKEYFENPNFEKFLYIYLFVSVVLNIIHTFSILSLKDFFVNTTNIFAFFIIYITIKKYGDEGMIKAIYKSLLTICVISSLVGIYQFIVDPYFFRIGAERLAFADKLRSNGVFKAEYIQSYFLISGIAVALMTLKSRILKYLLVALFLIGIIFAFHRMSWVVTIILFAIYFIKIKKVKILYVTIVAGIALVMIFFFSSRSFLLVDEFGHSHIVQERLFIDTITFRFNIYRMVLNNIPKSWLIGFGTPKSDVYYHGMLRLGAGEDWANAERGGLHNGFLHIMFFEGVPAMILFIIFLLSIIFYFYYLKDKKHIFYFIPFFEVTKFTLSNISNVFPIYGELGLLMAISIAVGVVAYRKKIDLNKIMVNYADT